jgi:hypothetical protein
MLGRVLLGVGDENQIVDDVHTVRSVSGWQVRITERSAAQSRH